jgi:hypothetical protein
MASLGELTGDILGAMALRPTLALASAVGALALLVGACGEVSKLETGLSPTSTQLEALPTTDASAGDGVGSGPTVEDRGPIVVVGDSLTWESGAGLEAGLRASGWRPVILDSFPGRQVTDAMPDPYSGLTATKRILIENDLRDPLWIVALGTNDIGVDGRSVEANRSANEALLGVLGSEARVVWVEVWRPDLPSASLDYNVMLQELSRDWQNLRIAPWAGEAWGHPEWFESDLIHNSPVGMQARNQFLVAQSLIE